MMRHAVLFGILRILIPTSIHNSRGACLCLQYIFVKEFFDDAEMVGKVAAAQPRVTASVEAVLANAGVQAWLADRPKTAF